MYDHLDQFEWGTVNCGFATIARVQTSLGEHFNVRMCHSLIDLLRYLDILK